jgi:hypothetical protein
MKVQSFTLLGASVLAGVQAAMTQALDAWAVEWGVPADALCVRAERAYECGAPGLGAPAWTSLRMQGRQAYFAWHPELAGALQRLLFAPDGSHAPQADGPAHVAASAARKACAALADALAKVAMTGATQAGLAANEQPAAALSARGAGAVLLLVQAGRHESRVLLNDACVRALLAPAKPAAGAPLAAVDYWRAVAEADVTLDLTIGAAKVGLGNLMTLAVGDVIRLDAAVERPVSLTARGGAPLLAAYLGKTGDQIAVEITGLT